MPTEEACMWVPDVEGAKEELWTAFHECQGHGAADSTMAKIGAAGCYFNGMFSWLRRRQKQSAICLQSRKGMMQH